MRWVDVWLGILLWFNALVFLAGSLAGWAFDQWIIFDGVAVIVCGLIGFLKRIRILQLISAAVVLGVLLRLTTPLWLLIDLLVIGSCLHVGYLFLPAKG